MSRSPVSIESTAEKLVEIYLEELGATFEREKTFDPSRGWRFDFALPAEKIAVEVEGWGHRVKTRYEKDLEKYNAAAALGWSLFRFTPKQIATTDLFKETLKPVLRERLASKQAREPHGANEQGVRARLSAEDEAFLERLKVATYTTPRIIPRSVLSTLARSSVTPDQITEAFQRCDYRFIRLINGVGPKTYDKICRYWINYCQPKEREAIFKPKGYFWDVLK